VKRRSRRASAMIEFVIVFPIAMAFLMLSVDIGRVYMTANSLQLATSRAVKAGAIYGAAGKTPQIESQPCASYEGSVRREYVVLDTFCANLYGLPGGASIISSTNRLKITGGPGETQICSKSNPNIKIEARVSIASAVPGAGALLSRGSDKSTLPGSWSVSLQSAAVCEVVTE
jgi:hypothetical protein